MAIVALAFTFAWIGIVAGVPCYLRLRRTGEIDVIASARRGSAPWWAKWIATIGFGFALGAPVAELAGLPPFAPRDQAGVRVVGIVLVILGIVVTLAAQFAMGASWRPDVDPEARTELVTTGPFRYVRNPILSGVAITAVGLALVVPNVLAIVMLLAFLAAMEIQVRLAEEPYLRRVHGDAYRRYAARTGRFVPWIGRLKT